MRGRSKQRGQREWSRRRERLKQPVRASVVGRGAALATTRRSNRSATLPWPPRRLVGTGRAVGPTGAAVLRISYPSILGANQDKWQTSLLMYRGDVLEGPPMSGSHGLTGHSTFFSAKPRLSSDSDFFATRVRNYQMAHHKRINRHNRHDRYVCRDRENPRCPGASGTEGEVTCCAWGVRGRGKGGRAGKA